MNIKILLILCFSFFISTNIYSEDLFESNYNLVKFEDDDLESKKISAINELKIYTLKLILSKILIEKDYKILSKNIDTNFANNLIKNIIIEDEKIINNRYSAKIKINYNKELIIYLLRSKKFHMLNLFLIIF